MAKMRAGIFSEAEQLIIERWSEIESLELAVAHLKKDGMARFREAIAGVIRTSAWGRGLQVKVTDEGIDFWKDGWRNTDKDVGVLMVARNVEWNCLRFEGFDEDTEEEGVWVGILGHEPNAKKRTELAAALEQAAPSTPTFHPEKPEPKAWSEWIYTYVDLVHSHLRDEEQAVQKVVTACSQTWEAFAQVIDRRRA